MTSEELCMELITCDTVEIQKVNQRLYCIIGFNRNTKDTKDSYWENDGERYDFDYVDRHIIASGMSKSKLDASIRLYEKMHRMSMNEFLLSPEGVVK